jgi:hypothetical protein
MPTVLERSTDPLAGWKKHSLGMGAKHGPRARCRQLSSGIRLAESVGDTNFSSNMPSGYVAPVFEGFVSDLGDDWCLTTGMGDTLSQTVICQVLLSQWNEQVSKTGSWRPFLPARQHFANILASAKVLKALTFKSLFSLLVAMCRSGE